MDDEILSLLLDLHASNQRQGPGSDEATQRALELAGLDRSRPLKIADIGCGTGASALLLAQALNAQVVAVDFLPGFLEVLQANASARGLAGQITTVSASMDALPFAEDEFDVIWSEGAIYNMGFEAGVSAWRRVLKPGGKLIVSEITWLGVTRPAEIQAHWEQEYPQIDLASAKMAQLERNGYSPRGFFVLPTACWLENYYGPLQARFEPFLEAHGHSASARAVVEAERQEIALYEKYRDFYSYGVYIAQKV